MLNKDRDSGHHGPIRNKEIDNSSGARKKIKQRGVIFRLGTTVLTIPLLAGVLQLKGDTSISSPFVGHSAVTDNNHSDHYVKTPSLDKTGIWSGYAVDTGKPVDGVESVITVPTHVNCRYPGSRITGWTGIAEEKQGPIEQAGIVTTCKKGKPVTTSWTEMYSPSTVTPAQTTTDLHIRSGDKVKVQIIYRGKENFDLSLLNENNGKFYNKKAHCPVNSCPRDSAVWVNEEMHHLIFNPLPIPSSFDPITFTDNFLITEFGQRKPLNAFSRNLITFEVSGFYPSTQKKILLAPNPISSGVGSTFRDRRFHSGIQY